MNMESRSSRSERKAAIVPRRYDQKCRAISCWEAWVQRRTIWKGTFKVVGKKLIVCNRAAKWWDEEVIGAIRVCRQAHA